jgi:hypothetical protein
MGSLIPNAKVQFSDASGRPLVGGSVYMYFVGTENFKDTYQNPGQTILNTNPIVLDGSGEAVIWGNGAYRQVVTDKFGVQIWDQVTQDANASLMGNMTDDTFIAGDGVAPNTFLPGTTAALTLSAAFGAVPNIWVFFDGIEQQPSQITSLVGFVLTFSAPIPAGTKEVFVKGGTTVALGTPGAGTVNDASVSRSSKLYNRITDYASVKDYGALGDGVTDDSLAFTNALIANALVYVPAGTYNVGTVNVPVNATLMGAGKGASILRPTTTQEHVLFLNAGACVKDLTVNGNNLTSNNVKTQGDYIRIENVHSQFCASGFYHVASDVCQMVNTSTDNCSFASIYSADRFINCFISRHESRGADTYGFFSTYTTQQPQSVMFDQCLFFGNTANGIHFDKDVFVVAITDTLIDGCTGHAVFFNNSSGGLCVDISIRGGFFFSNDVALYFKAATNHVTIDSVCASGTSTFATIAWEADATFGNSDFASITNSRIGTTGASGSCIIADSVFNLTVDKTYFSAGSVAIKTLNTVGSFPVVVKNCQFSTATTFAGPVNPIAYENNFTNNTGNTRTSGVATLLSGTTVLTITHGLYATPTNVLVTPQGNVGNYWITNIGPTQFQFVCSVAPGSNVTIGYEARVN